MPTLIEFSGMKFYMNFINNDHNPPHIHVESAGSRVSINLHDFSYKGNLPPKKLKKALKWAKKNQKILLKLWESQEFEELPKFKK